MSALTASLTTPFTAPSAVFWAALSLAVAVDARRTRQLSAVTRGASVRRGIRAVVFAYAADAALLLVLSLATDAGTAAAAKLADVVDFTSLLLEDFAEAGFLLLLLAVAAGAGTVRATGLGPHRTKVLAVPAVYLATTLAVDLTEQYVSWKNGAVVAEIEGGAAGVLKGSAATLFSACQIVSLVAVVLAWLMVFDVAQSTKAELEPQAEGIVGIGGGGGIAGGGSRRRVNDDGGVGHNVDLPPEVVAAAAERGDATLSETYAEVSRDARDDEPKSAAEAVATRAKLTLLRRFLAGATCYVAARAAAIVVPLAVLPQPNQIDLAVAAASVAEDAVRLLFLAALAWIFRAREDSPYLMVWDGDDDADRDGRGGNGDEEGGGVARRREGGIIGAAGLTTELGVLSRGGGGGGAGSMEDDDDDDEERTTSTSKLPAPRVPLFAGQQRSDAAAVSSSTTTATAKTKTTAAAAAAAERSSNPASRSPHPPLAPPPPAAAVAPARAAVASSPSSRPAAAAGVDARFALDDDSDSDYGEEAQVREAGRKTAPSAAGAASGASPVTRHDSTEEVPL